MIDPSPAPAAPAPHHPSDDPLDGRSFGFWRRLARTMRVVRRLGPIALAFLRDRRRWLFFGAPRRVGPEAHRERARRMTEAIASLGPTFIKLGQVFAARADILPEPYLGEMGRLQDSVAPVPFAALEAVLRAEYGRDAREVFDALDPEPLAAASLGQVHRGRAGGRDVAVKVIRPGVERLVALDLEVSFRILWWLHLFFPNHHVRALATVVGEFEKRIREELDLRQEARNTEWFRRHFQADPRVRAPRVIEEFTRRRVLVTEFVRGTRIDRVQGMMEAGTVSLERLMGTLAETYLRMMLVDGRLHADPHPGNLLVEDDGTLVFLDFGMMVQIDRATRERLFRLSLAMARDDLDAAIGEMYGLGMIDPAVPRSEIRDAAQEILGIVQRGRELGQRRVQEMVAEILDAFYTWPLILPEELVYFLRAAALLEGIGFRYDPAYNGLESVRPVLEAMRGELMAAMGREAGAAARDLAGEARGALQALAAVVRRTEREELRVRVHPRDLYEVERTVSLLVRRMLLGLFAGVVAVVSTLVFVKTGSEWVLAAGNVLAFLTFVFVLFVPAHLLTRPRRHSRLARRRPGRPR